MYIFFILYSNFVAWSDQLEEAAAVIRNSSKLKYKEFRKEQVKLLYRNCRIEQTSLFGTDQEKYCTVSIEGNREEDILEVLKTPVEYSGGGVNRTLQEVLEEVGRSSYRYAEFVLEAS